MFRPLSLFLALRYTRAKKRSGFVSFISLASMIGIALGVAVLITVMSVMNGFDYKIKSKFFSIAPQLTIATRQNLADQWPSLMQQVNKEPEVLASSPFVNGKAMISHEGDVSGVQVFGIFPEYETKISMIGSKLVQGSLSSLVSGKYTAVIGAGLAKLLNVTVGDKIILLTTQTTISPLGIQPRYRQFSVSGIFSVGSGFGYDNNVIFTHIKDAERLFSGGPSVSGLHVKLKNLYQAHPINLQLAKKLPPGFTVTDWTQTFGAFFQALAMEKTMMFIILILIVGVAAFNLVSTLVMVVNDKQSDIAILRTLGAKRRDILVTFIFQGAIVGLIGTLIGVGLGLALSYYASEIVAFLQKTFHVQFIPSSVYFINYLPSRILPMDIVHIAGASFSLSLLATLYPSISAFRVQPAKALRYE